MVYKEKQKSSPEKMSSVNSQDEIDLNAAVEIKQEEELIIEDSTTDVRWCFIGFDDNEDDEQDEVIQACDDGHQIASLNVSLDDVIEIVDDDDVGVYDSIYNFGSINESGEIGVGNEPIFETSFVTFDESVNDGDESTDLDKDSMVNDNSYVVVDDDECHESGNHNECTNGDAYHTEDEPDDDAMEFIEETTVVTPTRSHRRNKENANATMPKEEFINVTVLKQLLFRKYMKIVCQLCNESFSFGVYPWLRHINLKHQDFYNKMLEIYRYQTENLATCKLCKVSINSKVSHMFHFVLQHHSEEVAPKIFVCSVCNYADSSVYALQEHQKEKHPIDENETYEDCPKCLASGFKNVPSVEYHFMTAHSREFWGKFRYTCHLCATVDPPRFYSNRNMYFDHLIKDHKLDNWKILKFRKFDGGHHLQCPECFKVFTKTNDFNRLLVHYLSHQKNCYWSCKFCETIHKIQDWPGLHLCNVMKEYYRGGKTRNRDIDDNKPGKQKTINSWHEFEVYVKHVCPFCQVEFDKFEDWRLHLREIHFIHTLEGLNMSLIAEDPNKFQCLECLAPVAKSAVELHKHRFQHLPHQPYKCRHCKKTMATYNLALNHVATRCGNEMKPSTSKAVQIYKIRTAIESTISPDRLISISCPPCNNNKRFSNFEEISKHFRVVHGNFQQYFTKADKDRKTICKICRTELSRDSVSVIIVHYLQHLDEKPFKCRKCQRSFPITKRAHDHILNYHGTSMAIEKNNQKTIKKEKDTEATTKISKSLKKEKDVELDKSQKTIKKEKEDRKAIKKEKDVEPSKPQKSIKKEKGIETATLQNSTVKKENDEEWGNGRSRRSIKKEKPVEPEEYKSIFRLDDSCKVLKEFEQFIKYACPECNKPISTIAQWEQHVQTQHTFFHPANLSVFDANLGKQKCKDCNLILSDFISRQRRHKLSHMSYTAFICRICTSGFTLLGALYNHMRKIHFAKRFLKCPLCPKILSTEYDKSEHIKQTHSRKEWPGNMCLICFQTVSDMDSHVRITHVSRTKFSCGICGICFTYPKGLEIHMTTQHNGKGQKNELKAVTPTKNRSAKAVSTSVKRKKSKNNSSSPLPEDNNKAKKLCLVGIKAKGRKSSKKIN